MPEQRLGEAARFLAQLGVRPLPALTSPFDPGYDVATVESHLQQSGHLMSRLKLSMATWLIASEDSTRRKIAAAAAAGVHIVTGGGPFEIAADRGQLPAFLKLCAGLGVRRIEAGRGFTDAALEPAEVIDLADRHGLEVQFELGKKHDGRFTAAIVDQLIAEGRDWLDAGAVEVVIEGRESARSVGLFDDNGSFDAELGDRFVAGLGIDRVSFEAPTKASQFALLDHFGPEVRLANVRLEELLRVEIYRRGLHADAYANSKLRPRSPIPA